jgi:hypothetical protein
MTQQVQKWETIDINKVHEALSNPIATDIFRHIAGNGKWTTVDQISPLAPSVKRFYTNINKLKEAGLLSKENGRYFLTSLGRIVAVQEEMVYRAIKMFWSLKTLDILKPQMPTEDFQKMVEHLIQDSSLCKTILQ